MLSHFRRLIAPVAGFDQTPISPPPIRKGTNVLNTRTLPASPNGALPPAPGQQPQRRPALNRIPELRNGAIRTYAELLGVQMPLNPITRYVRLSPVKSG